MGLFPKPKHICPDCGEKLVEEDSLEEGMMEKELWTGIYEGIFLIRRERFICINKKCPNCYHKTKHKFLIGLDGTIRDEHFVDDAMRSKRKRGAKK